MPRDCIECVSQIMNWPDTSDEKEIVYIIFYILLPEEWSLIDG
jgi:hypothetical protein